MLHARQEARARIQHDPGAAQGRFDLRVDRFRRRVLKRCFRPGNF
jgi:hypothetical protein